MEGCRLLKRLAVSIFYELNAGPRPPLFLHHSSSPWMFVYSRWLNHMKILLIQTLHGLAKCLTQMEVVCGDKSQIAEDLCDLELIAVMALRPVPQARHTCVRPEMRS